MQKLFYEVPKKTESKKDAVPDFFEYFKDKLPPTKRTKAEIDTEFYTYLNEQKRIDEERNAEEEQFRAGKVNINDAKAEDLEKIRGIGPSAAEKILNLRREKYFDDLEELRAIPRVNDTILNLMKESFYCDDCAGNVKWMNNFDLVYKGGNFMQRGDLLTRYAKPGDPTNQLGQLVVFYNWFDALNFSPQDTAMMSFCKSLVELSEEKAILCTSGTAFVVGHRKPFSHAITSAHCWRGFLKKSEIKEAWEKVEKFLTEKYDSCNLEHGMLAEVLQTLIRKVKEVKLFSPIAAKHGKFIFQRNGPIHQGIFPVPLCNVHIYPTYNPLDDSVTMASRDIAVMKLDGTVSPQGKGLKLTRLQGSPEDLELIKSINIFGYVTSDLTSGNIRRNTFLSPQADSSQTFIRGSAGYCKQTSSHENLQEKVRDLQFKDDEGIMVVRGEYCFGHSGAPAICVRNGDLHVVGIVSRHFNGNEGHGCTDDAVWADAALTVFTDAKIAWLKQILRTESPRYGRMKASQFAQRM